MGDGNGCFCGGPHEQTPEFLKMVLALERNIAETSLPKQKKDAGNKEQVSV